MLKLRILTAAILIPLVVFGIFYASPFYFKLITAVVMLLAAWEWSRLSAWNGWQKRGLYVIVQALILSVSLSYLKSDWLIKLGVGFWLVLACYLVWVRSRAKLPALSPVVSTVLGWVVIGLCWVALQSLQLNPVYLLFMLLTVWLIDTTAYISGRLWGKHVLAPTISPKKTWEGFIMGLIFTFLILMLIYSFYKGVKPSFWQMGWLILSTSLAAIVGDLFESQLKRLSGLKDSGQLLPGHGGILDRIDSLLAAAPVFAGSLYLLGLLR